MQQYEDALTHFKQALEIQRNTSLDEWKDGNMARMLNNIGMCLINMQQYEDALTHLKQALDVNYRIKIHSIVFVRFPHGAKSSHESGLAIKCASEVRQS